MAVMMRAGQPTSPRRQAKPDHRCGRKSLGLNESIHEVRRTDHHRGSRAQVGTRHHAESVDRGGDPGCDVRSGRRLRGSQNGALVEDHGIGVGAPDIDPDDHDAAPNRDGWTENGLSKPTFENAR
jgi:hypothetical protein